MLALSGSDLKLVSETGHQSLQQRMRFSLKVKKLNAGCSEGSHRISPGLTSASALPAHCSAERLLVDFHAIARLVVLHKQK